MLVTLPPPRTRFDPLLLIRPPGFTAIRPRLLTSVTLAVPVIVTDPLAATDPPFQASVWPVPTVNAPPLLKFVTDAGPVCVTVALVSVLTPLRAVPPARANPPAPRRKPPLTAAPFSV